MVNGVHGKEGCEKRRDLRRHFWKDGGNFAGGTSHYPDFGNGQSVVRTWSN